MFSSASKARTPEIPADLAIGRRSGSASLSCGRASIPWLLTAPRSFAVSRFATTITLGADERLPDGIARADPGDHLPLLGAEVHLHDEQPVRVRVRLGREHAPDAQLDLAEVVDRDQGAGPSAVEVASSRAPRAAKAEGRGILASCSSGAGAVSTARRGASRRARGRARGPICSAAAETRCGLA